jgi:hypothetical protein
MGVASIDATRQASPATIFTAFLSMGSGRNFMFRFLSVSTKKEFGNAKKQN